MYAYINLLIMKYAKCTYTDISLRMRISEIIVRCLSIMIEIIIYLVCIVSRKKLLEASTKT